MNQTLGFFFTYNKKLLKTYKNMILFKFFWGKCSFIVSERAICPKNRAIHSLAFLSWGTWANRSGSLFCHERPERFAHGRSFVMSDLRDLLTVAHLFWAIWGNHSPSPIKMRNLGRMRDERMIEFPTLDRSQVCYQSATHIPEKIRGLALLAGRWVGLPLRWIPGGGQKRMLGPW